MKKILLIIFCLVFTFLSFNSIQANDLTNAFKTSDKVAETAGYDSEDNPNSIAGQVINIVFSFLGVIFLGLMVYGGFLWMTAGGNEEQVSKAKNILSSAVIGLIIVLAAYAISWFVVDRFVNNEALDTNKTETTTTTGNELRRQYTN